MKAAGQRLEELERAARAMLKRYRGADVGGVGEPVEREVQAAQAHDLLQPMIEQIAGIFNQNRESSCFIFNEDLFYMPVKVP